MIATGLVASLVSIKSAIQRFAGDVILGHPLNTTYTFSDADHSYRMSRSIVVVFYRNEYPCNANHNAWASTFL